MCTCADTCTTGWISTCLLGHTPQLLAWQLQTGSNCMGTFSLRSNVDTVRLLKLVWQLPSLLWSERLGCLAQVWGARRFTPCARAKCISLTTMFVHIALQLCTRFYRSDQSQAFAECIFYALQVRVRTIKGFVRVKNIFYWGEPKRAPHKSLIRENRCTFVCMYVCMYVRCM